MNVMVEQLSGVTVLWISDWWDGPVAGLASFDGHDRWFRAIFDEEADEYPSPRRYRLFEISEPELVKQWDMHHHWEEVGGGGWCFHDGAPDSNLLPGWQDFYRRYPVDQFREVVTGREIGEFTPPRESFRRPEG
jgi:hypothetical protein